MPADPKLVILIDPWDADIAATHPEETQWVITASKSPLDCPLQFLRDYAEGQT
jgi:hypothetical protein